MTVLACAGCGMKFTVRHPRSKDAAEAFKDWHSRYGCSVFELEDEDEHADT